MASMRTLRLSAALALVAAGLFAATPTVQEAKKFLDDAEKKLLALGNQAGQASWVQSTYITDDTEAIAAQANERAIAENVRLAKAATRFDRLKLPPNMARKMMLLKNGLVLAAPADPAESAEVTRLAASLDAAYGKGKYCPDSLAPTQTKTEKKCLDIEDITRIMANSTDPKELLDAWKGWHSISPPM